MGKIAIVNPSESARRERTHLSLQQKHCTTLLKHTTVELIVKDLVRKNTGAGGGASGILDNNNTIKQVIYTNHRSIEI